MLCNDRFLGLKSKSNPLTSMHYLNKCRAYRVIDETEQIMNQDNKKLFADTRQPQIYHVFPPIGNALNTILKDGRQKSQIKSYTLKCSAFYASLTDLFYFFFPWIFPWIQTEERKTTLFSKWKVHTPDNSRSSVTPMVHVGLRAPSRKDDGKAQPPSAQERLSAPPGTVKLGHG